MKLVTLTETGFNKLMEMNEVVPFILENFPFFNDGLLSGQTNSEPIALFKLSQEIDDANIFRKHSEKGEFRNRILNTNLYNIVENELDDRYYEQLIRGEILQEKEMGFIDIVIFYQDNDKLSLYEAIVEAINNEAYDGGLEDLLVQKVLEISLLKEENAELHAQFVFTLENYEMLSDIYVKPSGHRHRGKLRPNKG